MINVKKMIVDGVIFEVSSSAIFTNRSATVGGLVISHNIYHTIGDYLINFSDMKGSSILDATLIESNNVDRSKGFSLPRGAGTALLIVNNVGYNPQPGSAIIIHEAPFKYTNNDGYPG
jgi:hypothetical protein